MTESSFPFDNADVYEAQWSLLMRQAALCNGYIPSMYNDLFVYADSSGMQVKIMAGACWIMGHYYRTDADLVRAVAASDPTNPRWDNVVARLDWTNNVITIAVVTGAPGAVPNPPALTQSSSIYEIKLAQIYVAAGVITIGGTIVRDTRLSCFGSYNIEVPFGDGVSVIPTGVSKTGTIVQWPGRIDRWTLEANVAGGLQIDIWKDLLTNHPPTNVDTIITSGKPVLSAARLASGSVLPVSGTGATSQWAGAVLLGPTAPILGTNEYSLLYNVDSASTITKAMLTLRVQRHPFWSGIS
jgi:hypothetical protein